MTHTWHTTFKFQITESIPKTKINNRLKYTTLFTHILLRNSGAGSRCHLQNTVRRCVISAAGYLQCKAVDWPGRSYWWVKICLPWTHSQRVWGFVVSLCRNLECSLVYVGAKGEKVVYIHTLWSYGQVVSMGGIKTGELLGPLGS